MTYELFIFVGLSIVLLGFLVYLRRKESQYLKKSTKETLSSELYEEIEKEREINLEKKHKFEEIMKEATGGRYSKSE